MTLEKVSPYECGFAPFAGDVPHYPRGKAIFCFISYLVIYGVVIISIFKWINDMPLKHFESLQVLQDLATVERGPEMASQIKIEQVITVHQELDTNLRPWSSYIIPAVAATITVGLLFPALPGAVVGLV